MTDRGMAASASCTVTGKSTVARSTRDSPGVAAEAAPRQGRLLGSRRTLNEALPVRELNASSLWTKRGTTRVRRERTSLGASVCLDAHSEGGARKRVQCEGRLTYN